MTLVDLIREISSFPGEFARKIGGGGNLKELEGGVLRAPSTSISLAWDLKNLLAFWPKRKGEEMRSLSTPASPNLHLL